ncbi:protein PFC0760c-like [Diabrotica virgifera virgifera]|uniref:Protein PFC0760c-like n=1 Tax=Diabrotica virgifera virgifera TaxID=50390 RepID=A0ABM5KS55_DIAVI|nr:protein PFC0760c-like [Diabrotica virgifera virgifera]
MGTSDNENLAEEMEMTNSDDDIGGEAHELHEEEQDEMLENIESDKNIEVDGNNLKIGTFVVVQFLTKKTVKHFIGIIVVINDDNTYCTLSIYLFKMQSKQSLNDFPKISLNLKNSALSALKALHVVAYGDKGLPRQTRKNLRNFTNFAWDKESQEYSTKLDDIKNKLSMPDLVAVCSVLDLNYTGSEDDVIERICSFLNDFNLEDENDDEDEVASDDDGDKDVYHGENGKDVTEDDRYNEDNDANSDKDAYHDEEGKDVTDDDNNDDDMDDERTTDLFTRNRSKSNKMT